MPFDNALIYAERKNGSRKFLLKQKEVAEASLLGEIHSSVFRPATVRTFATVAFPQHRYC